MMAFIVLKTWTYRGCTLSINHVQNIPDYEIEKMKALWGGELSPVMAQLVRGHYCGYVESAIHITDEDIDLIDVHGGITYAHTKDNTAVYGFDCNHYPGTIDEWTIERVTAETERLADAILQYQIEEPERDA